jgi:hypothetical protein
VTRCERSGTTGSSPRRTDLDLAKTRRHRRGGRALLFADNVDLANPRAFVQDPGEVRRSAASSQTCSFIADTGQSMQRARRGQSSHNCDCELDGAPVPNRNKSHALSARGQEDCKVRHDRESRCDCLHANGLPDLECATRRTITSERLARSMSSAYAVLSVETTRVDLRRKTQTWLRRP